MLWVYRTTPYNITGETPYSLAFGVEAKVLVKIGLPSYRTAHFSQEGNKDSLRVELNLLEEKQKVVNL